MRFLKTKQIILEAECSKDAIAKRNCDSAREALTAYQAVMEMIERMKVQDEFRVFRKKTVLWVVYVPGLRPVTSEEKELFRIRSKYRLSTETVVDRG